MNKKILIGSIIAGTILIGVSFTSVVGYQRDSSATIFETSPLFTIRTTRAVGEEHKVLTCTYAQDGTLLPFPEQNEKTVLIRKFIDNIRNMDDETFEKFFASIINHKQKNNRLNYVKPYRIREALYQVRYTDEPIPILDASTENTTYGHGLKGFLGCTLSEPFCFFKSIIIMIIGFIVWCSNSPPTMILTGCCGPTLDCPKTLRRIFS
jgi:hypothetical protein